MTSLSTYLEILEPIDFLAYHAKAILLGALDCLICCWNPSKGYSYCHFAVVSVSLVLSQKWTHLMQIHLLLITQMLVQEF